MRQMTEKSKNSNLVLKEVEDLAQRLNDVELDLVDAKEFSHLSSDAFLVLQNQINELKELIESMYSQNNLENNPSHGVYL